MLCRPELLAELHVLHLDRVKKESGSDVSDSIIECFYRKSTEKNNTVTQHDNHARGETLLNSAVFISLDVRLKVM